jgi:hypothetical protein
MDLSKNLPSTDDILRALGQNRRAGNDILPGLALFGAGLLVGAGLALLFAPSSGEELRAEIGERAKEVGRGLTDGGEERPGTEPHGA